MARTLTCLVIATASLVGCEPPNRKAYDREQVYQNIYKTCLYQVTGPFAGASFDVMKACQHEAKQKTAALLKGPTP